MHTEEENGAKNGMILVMVALSSSQQFWTQIPSLFFDIF